MSIFFLYSAIAVSVIIAIPLYRVMKGPTVFDRLIGANTVATKTIVLICLIGFVYERIGMFIDITLAYAILGFLGSLMVAKYMISNRGRRHD